MKLLSYSHKNKQCLGALIGENILDINKAFNEKIGGAFLDTDKVFDLEMLDFLNLGKDGRDELQKAVYATEEGSYSSLKSSDVKILAPIPRPKKNIVCLGLNYADHIKEDSESRTGANIDIPEHPIFFTKPPTTVIGPNEPIVYPKSTQKLDYEVELALIIGKKGKYIQQEKSLSYVAGYTILNDISARDLQTQHQQWFMGKSCDTFAPMGPVILTKDEIENPHDLDLSLNVNGEIRQQANTRDMIFKIPEIISSLSNGITLEIGDIIATGTPSGVGMAHPKGMLAPGDTVSATIEKIGTLENKVVAEE
jgi:2-keto-4-pentenoate hydratase/2-oxohepta-3-ene-1,7-dioic acid hydratase in catechol pathway